MHVYLTLYALSLLDVHVYSKFCLQEFEKFKVHGGYQECYSRGLQTSAKVTLGIEWLVRA